MKLQHSKIIFSPSDLANHISCRHLTNLNKKAALGELKKPIYKNRVLEMLRDRGLKFEAAFLEQLRSEGKSIVEIDTENGNAEQDTIKAMKNGADVIYQARLMEAGKWGGWADFMLKIETPSDLGPWSYEVLDTKLATETRAGTILQIALYSEKIGSIQGVMPVNMWVENPDGRIPYRVDDYISFVRFAKSRLLSSIENEQATYPEPIVHCDICNWWEHCNKKRRQDDHLGFIAGMGTAQIKEMRCHEVNTLKTMAEWTMPDGDFIKLFFCVLFDSPCHLVTTISKSLQSSSTLLNWSFINAIKGDIYNICTPVSLKSTFDKIGKKAASVFPDAVFEARITLSSLDIIFVIAATCIGRNSSHPLFRIYLRIGSESNLYAIKFLLYYL